MVMIDVKGNQRSICKPLYELGMSIRKKINTHDVDSIVIIDGALGVGKSMVAKRLGYIIDPKITHEQICLDRVKFIEQCLKHKKRVVIADEGISMFFTRAAMSKNSKEIIELMTQIRQNNLCVIICVPSALLVDKFIRDLAKCHINVFAYSHERRGKTEFYKGGVTIYPAFSGFNYKDYYYKWLLASQKKKTNNPPYFSRGTGDRIGSDVWSPVDETKYLKEKSDILKKYIQPEEKKSKRALKYDLDEKQRIKNLHESLGLAQNVIAKLYNTDVAYINRIIKSDLTKI